VEDEHPEPDPQPFLVAAGTTKHWQHHRPGAVSGHCLDPVGASARGMAGDTRESQ
jgi:hypothetical protein